MAYHPLRNGKIEKANGSLKKTQGREKKRKVKKTKIVEKCVEVFISVKCKWTERGGWNVEGEKNKGEQIYTITTTTFSIISTL